MNAIGIDVSKGKSMVAAIRPGGEVIILPFEVEHTASELSALAKRLKSLDGETRVVMEYTGSYYLPVAYALHEAGLFVSAVHAKLIHDSGKDESIRRVKTDKADALKIANYGIEKWVKLRQFVPESDARRMLKLLSRQYNKYGKLKTMLKNNLISLTDNTFPGVNELFSSPPRPSDGHQKWIDFVTHFWHCECVCGGSVGMFAERYRKWCKRMGYRFNPTKAEDIYLSACGHFGVVEKNQFSKSLMIQAAAQLNAVCETQAAIAREMKHLAQMLPEYPVVSAFFGVGDILAPQLMAEIGDIYRFKKKGSLVCFAGLEVPVFQSGKFQAKEVPVSKKGSPHLRKALFQVMTCILQNAPANDPVFQFLDRKRAEGKHYYSYMTAGCAKFLRIYYARVKEYLDALDNVA